MSGLKELERVRREVAEEQGVCTVSVELCGDFQLHPNYGGHMGAVLKYKSTGEMGEEHPGWGSREGEEVEGLHLSSSITITKDCFLEKGSVEVVQVLLLIHHLLLLLL